MKEGVFMQIIPIKELRDTNKISDLCNETNEPIYITKNGYGDMVIMSIKTYDGLVVKKLTNKPSENK